jgi:eukaryotic-like serine/threonine-protein kinase
MAATPGSLLADRFEILEMLGAGGTAAVHRARDHATGRDVAVKVLWPTSGDGSYARESFEREASRLRRLPRGIPGIPALVAAGPGIIVTDLAAGSQLFHTAPPVWGFPFAELGLLVLRRVVDTLAALHKAGIAHGDVTCRNVLLSTSGPTLVDFGGPGDAALDLKQAVWLGYYLATTDERGWPVPPSAYTATCPRSVSDLLADRVPVPSLAVLREHIDEALTDVGLLDPGEELATMLRDPVSYRRTFPTRALSALETSAAARERYGERALEALAMHARVA